jgi:hypothetical protein
MALAVRLRSESFFLDTGPLAWSSLEATTRVRCGTGVEPLPARALPCAPSHDQRGLLLVC